MAKADEFRVFRNEVRGILRRLRRPRNSPRAGKIRKGRGNGKGLRGSRYARVLRHVRARKKGIFLRPARRGFSRANRDRLPLRRVDCRAACRIRGGGDFKPYAVRISGDRDKNSLLRLARLRQARIATRGIRVFRRDTRVVPRARGVACRAEGGGLGARVGIPASKSGILGGDGSAVFRNGAELRGGV